jgi:hypothetical protein
MVRARKRPAGSVAREEKSAAPRVHRSGLWLWYQENKRWVPLLALVFGGALLFVLWRVESIQNEVAFVAGLGWLVGNVVWGLMQPSEAPARPGQSPVWIPLVALLTIATGLYVLSYVGAVFRGAPDFAATLAREGSTARFRLSRPKSRILVFVHGSFAPDVGTSAEGSYQVVLSRGEREIALDGKLERSTSRTRVRRGVRAASTSEYSYFSHEVAPLGAGEYVVEHAGTDDTLRRHLRVAVFTTWFSRPLLVGGGIAFFLIALFLDVVGARAGHRSRSASAAANIACFAVVFRAMATPDAVGNAVMLGALASVFGGAVLGWVAEQAAKRAGGEIGGRRSRDDDEDDED